MKEIEIVWILMSYTSDKHCGIRSQIKEHFAYILKISTYLIITRTSYISLVPSRLYRIGNQKGCYDHPPQTGDHT